HLITAPLDFTLQAVTLSSSSTLSLGVTNAIDVEVAVGAPPTITSVVPLSAGAGQPITVTGTNYRPGCTLLVNGVATATTSVSATQIVFPFPPGLACGSQLSVVNLDSQGVSSPLNPQPTVTGTILGTGPVAGGALFIVQGTGFAAGSTVTIGGAPATVLSASAVTITMNTPPGTAGQQAVVITTPGGCIANTTYTYQ
ncbi:MAG TPA: IPT/TIG domain-containing protein, partial [Ilumatobacteraceae bacterium]